jgi:proline iminopeptidase
MTRLLSSRRGVINLSIAAGSLALLNHTPALAEIEPQLGQVEVPGAVLSYQIMGSGPVIVLLAGGPGVSSEYLLPLARMLAETHRVVLPQGRGMGRSTVSRYDTETINFPAYVADIEALRVHLSVEQWSVLGHSWGASWALRYLAAYRAHMGAMVLLDGTYLDAATAKTRNEQRTAARSPKENKALSYWSEPERIAEDPEKANLERWKVLLPSFFHDRSKGEQYMRDITPDRFNAAVSRLMAADTPKIYDLVPSLRGLPVPALILQGQQDLVADSGQQFHALLPNSKLVIVPECGHFPWIEQPQALRTALLEFLSGKKV